jgi:hypothetical protein
MTDRAARLPGENSGAWQTCRMQPAQPQIVKSPHAYPLVIRRPDETVTRPSHNEYAKG